MSTTKEQTTAPPLDTEAKVAEAGSIDKIREILFGAQVKDLGDRIAHLEERLAEESASLRAQINQKLESLEVRMRAELDALASRLTAEESGRAEALREAHQRLESVAEGLEGKIARLAEEAAKTEAELRGQILDHSRKLAEKTEQEHRVVVTRVEERFRELHDEKADRAALAELFTELSHRLKGSNAGGQATEGSSRS
jgi:DNA anti-recombination protein RmuC